MPSLFLGELPVCLPAPAFVYSGGKRRLHLGAKNLVLLSQKALLNAGLRLQAFGASEVAVRQTGSLSHLKRSLSFISEFCVAIMQNNEQIA